MVASERPSGEEVTPPIPLLCGHLSTAGPLLAVLLLCCLYSSCHAVVKYFSWEQLLLPGVRAQKNRQFAQEGAACKDGCSPLSWSLDVMAEEEDGMRRMNLQRIAQALNYEKGRCEHCQGQGYLFRTEADAADGQKGLSLCTHCKQTGYLWYLKPADPQINNQRALGSGITTAQLLEHWQQRQTCQQP